MWFNAPCELLTGFTSFMTFTVRDLPLSERPRERLQKHGEEALSVQELLALILGRGSKNDSVLSVAQRLLSHFGDLNKLASAGLEELARIKGIGPAKAAQIKAVFELGKRSLSSWDKAEKTKISSAEDVFKLFGQRLKAKKKEHFLVLLLDARNRLIRSVEISVGSLDASIVHPREVFKEAIGESASRLILVHNHPSGDPKPSEADIEITGRLAAAGKILGLEILDHIIIGNKNASSLKEEGLF